MSQSHDFPTPACKPHDVPDRGDSSFVTVGGVHPPPHVLPRGEWKEGGAAIPFTSPKRPGESEEIDGESWVDEGPYGQ